MATPELTVRFYGKSVLPGFPWELTMSTKDCDAVEHNLECICAGGASVYGGLGWR